MPLSPSCPFSCDQLRGLLPPPATPAASSRSALSLLLLVFVCHRWYRHWPSKPSLEITLWCVRRLSGWPRLTPWPPRTLSCGSPSLSFAAGASVLAAGAEQNGAVGIRLSFGRGRKRESGASQFYKYIYIYTGEQGRPYSSAPVAERAKIWN